MKTRKHIYSLSKTERKNLSKVMRTIHPPMKISYHTGITRDGRGIESQSDEDIAMDRHADKWEAEGKEDRDEE